MSLDKNYIDVTYDESHHPITPYPGRLTGYLAERYALPPGAALLDVGCGRGEFLRGFRDAGLEVAGVDRSLQANRFCPGAVVAACDLEEDPLPFPDDRFDVVFNKSVIEHFHRPERLVAQMRRVLKPGGLLITMTPDWNSQWRIFYEDFTHRTPFTPPSLRDILRIHDFRDIRVERFRQLPFLWKRPYLSPLCAAIAAVTPRSSIPWIRFSKEIMLLADARK